MVTWQLRLCLYFTAGARIRSGHLRIRGESLTVGLTKLDCSMRFPSHVRLREDRLLEFLLCSQLNIRM